jgi:hypothetical protein
MSKPNRQDAVRYVGHYLRVGVGMWLASPPYPITPNVTLVGWQCGFEPMFVALRPTTPEEEVIMSDCAIAVASRFLIDFGWFKGIEIREPDYVLEGNLLRQEVPEEKPYGVLDPKKEPELQRLADLFNETYLKAGGTSRSEDWHDAALIGRQLVYSLGRLGMFNDKFSRLQEELNGANKNT